MSQKGAVFPRLTSNGVYPFQMAWMLLLPFRNLYLSPSMLAKRVQLKGDSVVLELGCGPGALLYLNRTCRLLCSFPQGRTQSSGQRARKVVERPDHRLDLGFDRIDLICL